MSKKKKKKQMKRKERKLKMFYKISFFVGLIPMIWQIKIYRQTFIDFKLLLSIILIIGFLTMFFSLKDFQKLFEYKHKAMLYFMTFIQTTVSWGFLSCSIFMFSNYYLANNESIKETYEIVEKSSLAGSKYRRNERKPTFKILYKGKLKELVFRHKYYSKMETYEKIELEVRKGFWGYDLLLNQELK